jgi:hypothetical protein
MVGNQIDCLNLVVFLVHDFNLEFANGKCKFIFKIYFKTFLMILRKPNLDEVYCLHFVLKNLGHRMTPIPKVGKPLGSVGSHYFTLVGM